MNRVYWSLPWWLALVLLPVWVMLGLMWLVVVLPVKVLIWFLKVITPNKRDFQTLGRF